MTVKPKKASSAAPILLDRIAAAAALSVSPGTIDRLGKTGALRQRRIGRRVLYAAADLARYAAAL